MSLSTTLSSVSFLSHFWWIDWSHFEVFSCSFVCPATFDWMSDIVNFTLLGAGCFDIPLNVVEFCSGMWLSYLDVICVTAPEKSLVWAYTFPTTSNTFSYILPDAAWCTRFPLWLVENNCFQHHPSSVSSASFGGSFPDLRGTLYASLELFLFSAPHSGLLSW